jgi:teichuronic acid biosynthesis glycosyltransferase TuaC
MPGTTSKADGDRPRIAIVTPILPVPHDPTRGRFIYEIARSISRLTPTRVFFQQQRYPSLRLLQPRSYQYGVVGDEYRIDGLEVEAYSYPGLPLLSRPCNSRISSRALIPRLRSFAPDLILAYWVVPDGHAATIAARALSVPAVIGALGSDIYVRDWLNGWFTRRTLRSAEAVIAVAEQMRTAIVARYGAQPEQVHTIVNGFNTEVFYARSQQQMRLQLGLPVEARLIVYVGRLVQTKGLNELMAAFTAMAAGRSDLQLAFVGQGALRAELLEAARASGLDRRIHLPGGLTPDAVAQWIGASDLLCLPSWSEGYPNVLVEAIACGRPVVATNVGGTAEIVTPDNGLLVPARDPQRLREALSEALDRTWDHAAIAAAMRRTWDDVARETLDVCKQVLRSRQASGDLRR